MTDQPQQPAERDAAGQQPIPSQPAGDPEAPVGPPPPTIPLEPSGAAPASPADADAPPLVEPAAADPVPVSPAPAPAPPPEAAPPLGAPLAAGDGFPPTGLAHDRPEVLAGAAFAGGFLAALILKRLAS